MEKQYKITRKCLKQLSEYQHSVSILTKSPLVIRDLDILQQLTDIEIGFTITLLESKARRVFEPGAPPPEKRFQALRKLSDHNISTWIFVAPVLPLLTDSTQTLSLLMTQARKAGTRYILFDLLNPYPKVWKNVTRLVKKHFPKAVESYTAYRNNPDRYASRLKRTIEDMGLQHRVSCRFAFGCSP
jgi:DNA repair photolyase